MGRNRHAVCINAFNGINTPISQTTMRSRLKKPNIPSSTSPLPFKLVLISKQSIQTHARWKHWLSMSVTLPSSTFLPLLVQTQFHIQTKVPPVTYVIMLTTSHRRRCQRAISKVWSVDTKVVSWLRTIIIIWLNARIWRVRAAANWIIVGTDGAVRFDLESDLHYRL